MSEAQELNTLVGADETITVGGRTLTVNRIRMRQLPKVLDLMQPVIGIIMAGREAGEDKPKIDIGSMLLTHGPAVLNLISEIMTNKDQVVDADWVTDLELDEVINLTGKVFEVNLDFFIQKVVPALSTVLGSINAGIQFNLPAGMIPSQP